MEQRNQIVVTLPKPPSLNQFYAGKHWIVRKKHKDNYKNQLDLIFNEYEEFTAETFEIHIQHNSRFDVDNCILSVKFLADYLRDREWVLDDTKKYFKKFSISVNEELNKDEFRATIVLYGYKE